MVVNTVDNRSRAPRVFKGTVHIVTERCKGCELCITYCPKKILEVSEEFNVKGYHYPVVKSQDDCMNCQVCEDICPEFAIYSVGREERPEQPDR